MIYALYHAPHENSGLIGDVVKEMGLPFKEVHLYAGEGLPRSVSDLEGLIVMGGPMSVNDLSTYPFLLPEIQLIEKLLKEQKPILGICLGAQLIAKALGKKVYPNHTKEVGWHPIELTKEASADPMFKNLPKSFDVLHWHGETFDLPEGAVHLAKSKRCANQAFRWGDLVYGFQFHFEVTPAMVQNWCVTADGQADIVASGEVEEVILRKTPGAFARLEPMARALFVSYFKSAYNKLLPVG